MISIKKENEIKLLQIGGKILANILKKLAQEVKPGITTGYLEEMACNLIKKQGGRPSFKNYEMPGGEAFPTALCTSINNEVVHAPALPARQLNQGDIIGIDIGMEYPYKKNFKGYYTDMAMTVPVGKINKEIKKLLKVTKESLDLGIKQVKPYNSLNNIGETIQDYVESHGFSIVRELVGHGVGYECHEDPQVPNFKSAEAKKIILKPGMVIAIEPMVNIGGWKIKIGSDKNTILTADDSLSAHFEHTIAVTKTGYKIITLP